METLQHIFPLHRTHPPLAPPAPVQGPTSPPVPGTPQMPNSPGKAHVVADLSDTPEIMVASFDDEPMQGFEGHLKEEDDPEEQQIDWEIDEEVGEQEVHQATNEVEFGASDSSFNLGEEPKDESDLDYDPSRDC